eukprot:5349034-Amphidinium_carterae.1
MATDVDFRNTTGTRKMMETEKRKLKNPTVDQLHKMETELTAHHDSILCSSGTRETAPLQR